jgi:hypothetical protein
MIDQSILSEDRISHFRDLPQSGPEPGRKILFAVQQQPDSQGTPPKPKLAEDVYKNIQIFKGVPAARIPAVMENFSRWLGVQCDGCHVPQEFEKDDKPTKVAARRMMNMVRGIGKEYFGDANPVTCWTCHRGSLKPESLPKPEPK